MVHGRMSSVNRRLFPGLVAYEVLFLLLLLSPETMAAHHLPGLNTGDFEAAYDVGDRLGAYVR